MVAEGSWLGLPRKEQGAGEDGEVVQGMTAVLQCVLVRGDAHGVLEFKSVLYCLVSEFMMSGNLIVS